MKINENKLKSLLFKNGITKSSLGQKLGISSRTISKIGKGEDISIIVIDKICKFLNCSETDICSTNNILTKLQAEMNAKLSGGLYHQTQVKLTYNSNHMEGSKLTEEQTRFIFETHTLGEVASNINVDDIIETNNHFKCIDYIIENANQTLDKEFIKHLQFILKQGTEHARQYKIGAFKQLPNTVGGIETCLPENVERQMQCLLNEYNSLKNVTFEDIVKFHHDFEKIHPFQDGNGRVGRLIAFKECLKNNIIPFYIDDNNKWLYYRGLQEWDTEKNYLIETCKFGQDQYKILLDYFRIEY